MLGGGYYNVTIGANTFKPDKLPFTPTFEYFLVKSENRYYDKQGVAVQGTYKDSQVVNLTVNDVTVGYKQGSLDLTLKDSKGKAIKNAKISLKIKGLKTITVRTTTTGKATFTITKLTKVGSYKAYITFAGSKYYTKATAKSTIIIKK